MNIKWHKRVILLSLLSALPFVASAEETNLNVPILSPPNMVGINSEKFIETFKHGEEISVDEGRLTLHAPGPDLKFLQSRLDLRPALTPKISTFHDNLFPISKFNDGDLKVDNDLITLIPQAYPLGVFGQLIATHDGRVSEANLDLSDRWKFGVNGIVGMIVITPSVTTSASPPPWTHYYIVFQDGTVLNVNVDKDGVHQESGFRNPYRLSEGPNPTITDIDGNTYQFGGGGFDAGMGGTATAVQFEKKHCESNGFLFFQFESCHVSTHGYWTISGMTVSKYIDKFGNETIIRSPSESTVISPIDGTVSSVPPPSGYDSYTSIRTPLTKMAYLRRGQQVILKTNFDTARPDDDANRKVWVYDYDPEGNLSQVTNPVGNKIQVRYDLSPGLPAVRKLGDVFSYAPNEIIELSYPTGGVFRYEAFTAADLIGGIIVTEFPDKNNPSLAYQKYFVAGPDETYVYETDGTETVYGFSMIDGFRLCTSKTTKSSGEEHQEKYEWKTQDIPASDPAVKMVAGMLKITNAVNGIETVTERTYDSEGRLLTESVSSLGKLTTYDYWLDATEQPTDHIKSIKTDKLAVRTDGTLGTDSITLSIDRFDPTSCGIDPASLHLSDRAFIEGGRSLSDGSPPIKISRRCYDSYGNITREEGPTNYGVSHFYEANPSDSAQRPLYRTRSTTDDLSGHHEELTYQYDTAMMQMTRFSDANGQSVSFAKDAIDRMVNKGFTSGSSVHRDYLLAEGDHTGFDASLQNKNAILESQFDNSSNTTRQRAVIFDGLGLPVESRDPNQISTYYNYDSGKRLSSIETPAGIQQTTYDGFGRIKQIIGLGGSVTDMNYGREVIASFGLNLTVDTAQYVVTDNPPLKKYFDGSGNLVRLDQGAGAETRIVQYQYDQAGNLIRRRDSSDTLADYLSAADTLYVYDAFSRLSQRKNPDGTVFSIDDFQNGFKPSHFHLTGSGGENISRQASYDARDRLLSLSDSRGVYRTFSYDLNDNNQNGLGRLVSVSEPSGQTQYFYNIAGGLTRLETTMTPPLPKGPFDFYFSPDGYQGAASKSYPDGRSIFFRRDAAGNILEVRQDGGDGPILESSTYDAADRLATIQYGNGIVLSYTYNLSSRISKMVLTRAKDLKVLAQENYTYDAVGNKLETQRLDGSRVGYSYDSLNRIIQAQYYHPGEDSSYNTQNYRYDLNGHRQSYSDSYKSYQFQLDATKANRLSKVVALDSQGNVISGGREIDFEYDGFGNISGKKEYLNQQLLKSIEYRYDPEQRMTDFILKKSNGTIQTHATYQYDFMGRRIAKTVNGKSQYYLYGDSNLPLLELDADGSFRSTHVFANGHRIATFKDDQIYYFTSDELENTRWVTDSTGNIVQSLAFDPFGNTDLEVGSLDNDYRFAGREYDEESGLIYFGARYYDPELGQFLSKDPAESSANPYEYASNSPLLHRDLNGFFSLIPPGIFGVGRVYSGDESGDVGDEPIEPERIWLDDYGDGSGCPSMSICAYYDYTTGKTVFPDDDINDGGWSESPNPNIDEGIDIATGIGRPPDGFGEPPQMGRVDIPGGNVVPIGSSSNTAPNFNPVVSRTAPTSRSSLPTSLNQSTAQSIPMGRSLVLAGDVNATPVSGPIMPNYKSDQSVFSGGSGESVSGFDQEDIFGDPKIIELAHYEGEEDSPGTQAQEMLGNDQTSGNATDPILLHSGDLMQSNKDLRIPGRGIDFEFVRTYRSRILFDGPLGFNWDHNYNRRLVEEKDADGKLLGIARFDGKARFDFYEYLSETAKFETPAGLLDELTKNGDGTYTIRDRFGMVSLYDVDGYITSLSDRDQNSLQFHYETPTEGKRLTEVVDTLGRSIAYQYDAAGILSKVVDFSGREVVFTHDANKDLIAVRSPVTTDFPQGKTTTYAYSSGYSVDRKDLNHNLLTVTDARGQTYLENEYSIEDRVVSQRFGDEGTFHLGYQKVAGVSQCDEAHVDDVIYKTNVLDRAGNTTDWEFNCQGNPLKKTEWTRGVHDEDPAKFVTAYRYNRHGLIVEMTPPLGNKVSYQYQAGVRLAEGNLVQITREKDSVRPGGNPIIVKMSYEPVFNQLQSVIDPRASDPGYVAPNGGSVSDDRYKTLFQFDASGHVVKKISPSPKDLDGGTKVVEEVFAYNAYGQIIAHTDAVGITDTYDYFTAGPQNGYLKTITRAAGAEAVTNQFSYDAVGNLVSFTDGRNNTFAFEVNDLNQVTKEIAPAPLNYETQYAYDANNNLESIQVQNKDALGVLSPTHPWIKTQLTYNSLDRVTSRTQEISQSKKVLTEYQYDLNENVARIVQPNGNSIKIEYDERDLPAKVIRGFGSADSSTTSFDYDGNRNRTKMTDGRGLVAHYAYDGFDRLIQMKDAAGDTTDRVYDPASNLTNIQRRGPPAGVQFLSFLFAERQFVPDELNEILQKKEALIDDSFTKIRDVLTTYQYDAARRPVQIKDDNQRITQFVYDGLDRLTKATDPLGNEIVSQYDEANNLVLQKTREIDPSAPGGFGEFAIQHQYDSLGREIALVDALGNTSRKGYDSRGNVDSIIDAKNNTTRFVYDGLNRRVQDLHDLSVTTYDYDDNNRLAKITDANNHATEFQYDALNRRTQLKLADGSVYGYQYDATNNLTALNDPRGYQVKLAYDEANRLKTRESTLAGALKRKDRFDYDGVSRLGHASSEDESGTPLSALEFRYDSLNRVLKEIQDGDTVSADYDGVGNQLQLNYPSGYAVTKSYDELNRLTKIENPALDDLLNQDYVGLGRLKNRNYLNQAHTQYSYDALQRLTQQDHLDPVNSTLAGFTYGYDPVGQKVFEKRSHESDLAQVYRYDSWNRLTSVREGIVDPIAELSVPNSQPATRSIDWVLDGANNWTSQTIDAATSNFTSTPANAYIQKDATAFAYDQAGNLTDRGDLLFEYNERSLVSLVKKKSDGSTLASFEYDAIGRRVKKTDAVSSQTIRYLYQGQNLLEERDGSDQLIARYTYTDQINEPIQIEKAGQSYFYHQDSIGNVVALTDSTGQVVEKYSYEAYGAPTVHDGSGAVIPQSAIGNPFLFNAQYYDQEIGLYSYRARHYDPTLGRFLQRDPMGFVDGVNLYAYVGNNPINWVDPWGFNTTASQFNSGAGKPSGQNSYIGNVTGSPFTGYVGPYGMPPINLNTGNPWIDPTLGLINDAANSIAMAPNGVFNALGYTNEGLGRIGCDFQCIAVTEQSMGPPGMVMGAITQGLGYAANVGRITSLTSEMDVLARGAAVQTPGVTAAGERFIRVGANPNNLKFTFQNPGGVQPGTYAFPESTFNAIGNNPAALKNFGDLPGTAPQYYRILEPPAGTPIQRGVVPGGQYGGVGEAEEVIFPKGF